MIFHLHMCFNFYTVYFYKKYVFFKPLLFFFFFLVTQGSMWILVPWIRDQTQAPAVKVQSPNPQMATELPKICCCFFLIRAVSGGPVVKIPCF